MKIIRSLADTALNLAAALALFYLIFVVAWGRAVGEAGGDDDRAAAFPCDSDRIPFSESAAAWCAGRSGATATKEARHETKAADSEAIALPTGPGGIDVPGLWPH